MSQSQLISTWEDVRSRESVLGTVIKKIFFPWYLHLWPSVRTNTDDSPGTNALNDEVGLELDLYAAAATGILPLVFSIRRNLPPEAMCPGP